MGYYINSPSGSKEDWLDTHGQACSREEALASHSTMPGLLPVCLVDNGPFTAAVIGYSPAETKVFAEPSDHRPKKWYMVSREDLKPYYPKA